MPADSESLSHGEYKWPSYDGLMLYAQSWMPAKKPRGIVNYIHGFKDHSNRFSKWAEKLTREGFGVMAIDLRGHGRSEGRRGYAPSFDHYLKDVQELCVQSRKKYDDIPQFLYGHSLGGNIVTNYLIRGLDLPDAAIITSPWFTLSFKPTMITLSAATIMRYLLPFVMIPSNLDPKGLSHDPRVVADYLNDPLVHNKISPRLFFEIEERGLKASRSIYKINIPLLVMHGAADPITSCRQTRAFVMNAGKRTTYKEWSGCFHELHNDTQSEEVFLFLVNWLNNQVF
jgi:alpha-beta hydrolase superfamily lysophospholipase